MEFQQVSDTLRFRMCHPGGNRKGRCWLLKYDLLPFMTHARFRCIKSWWNVFILESVNQRSYQHTQCLWYLCCVCAHVLSCVQLFCSRVERGPPGSSLHGIPRQEHWSELSLPPPGGLPDPGIKPESPALAGGFFTTEHLGSLTITFLENTLNKIEYFFFPKPPTCVVV